MTNSEKFFTAVLTLKPNTQFSLYGEIENENDFFNNWHAYGINRSQENIKVINAG